MKIRKWTEATLVNLLLILFVSGCTATAALAAAESQTAAGTPGASEDANRGTAKTIRERYLDRFPWAKKFAEADQVQDGKSQGPGQITVDGPLYKWPEKHEGSLSADVPSKRDEAIGKHLVKTFGLPVSDTQFQVISRLNDNMLLEEAFDPERWMWMETAMGTIKATSAANSVANLARNQAVGAVQFSQNFLPNFTTDTGNVWNTIRNDLFIPMALLLLLPGAVLSQVRAIVAQGTSVLGEVNPFEGILRSIVAIFLIPATYLVVNYGIDVSNAIAREINNGYSRVFKGDMYEDAQCAMRRALPLRKDTENKNHIPTDGSKSEPAPAGNEDSPRAQLEAISMDIGASQECGGNNGGGKGKDGNTNKDSGKDKSGNSDNGGGGSASNGDSGNASDGGSGDEGAASKDDGKADEEVPVLVTTQRLLISGANAGLAATWNVLCAFQMVYLYYLFCIGPVVAALWVWPMNQLRSALPSWIEGVVTLCFWSLFWNTTILLMAAFKDVDTTGTFIMTALNFLASASVKHAFNFGGLVAGAGAQVAAHAEKAGKGAGGSGGHGKHGAAHSAEGGGAHTGSGAQAHGKAGSGDSTNTAASDAHSSSSASGASSSPKTGSPGLLDSLSNSANSLFSGTGNAAGAAPGTTSGAASAGDGAAGGMGPGALDSGGFGPGAGNPGGDAAAMVGLPPSAQTDGATSGGSGGAGVGSGKDGSGGAPPTANATATVDLGNIAAGLGNSPNSLADATGYGAASGALGDAAAGAGSSMAGIATGSGGTVVSGTGVPGSDSSAVSTGGAQASVDGVASSGGMLWGSAMVADGAGAVAGHAAAGGALPPGERSATASSTGVANTLLEGMGPPPITAQTHAASPGLPGGWTTSGVSMPGVSPVVGDVKAPPFADSAAASSSTLTGASIPGTATSTAWNASDVGSNVASTSPVTSTSGSGDYGRSAAQAVAADAWVSYPSAPPPILSLAPPAHGDAWAAYASTPPPAVSAQPVAPADTGAANPATIAPAVSAQPVAPIDAWAAYPATPAPAASAQPVAPTDTWAAYAATPAPAAYAQPAAPTDAWAAYPPARAPVASAQPVAPPDAWAAYPVAPAPAPAPAAHAAPVAPADAWTAYIATPAQSAPAAFYSTDHYASAVPAPAPEHRSEPRAAYVAPSEPRHEHMPAFNAPVESTQLAPGHRASGGNALMSALGKAASSRGPADSAAGGNSSSLQSSHSDSQTGLPQRRENSLHDQVAQSSVKQFLRRGKNNRRDIPAAPWQTPPHGPAAASD